jgi:CDP-diglyceride synthetase
MKLIAFYIVFVLIGDLIAYFVGRTMPIRLFAKAMIRS